jgi:hypothetical protein
MKTMTKQIARRKSWAAWSIGDGRTCVQINEAALAKVFAKCKGVMRRGYSVLGPYAQLYVIEQPVTWAQDWLREQARKLAAVKTAAANTKERELAV